MGSLTDIAIKQLIRAKLPAAKSDGNGLTFTLSANGTAAWVLRYRLGGKGKELTLGRYPDISLAGARNLATDARAKVQQGIDVAREKQQAIIERAVAKNFRELADDYMEKTFPRLAANTVKQRGHHIKDILIPKMGSIPAKEVGASDVVSLIENVGKKSISVAELVFTAASEIFKHGIARHALTSNPCTGISVSAICGQAEPKRQRLKLTGEELKVVFSELPTIGQENALAVKVQLATCVRPGELAKAEWSYIDFEKAEWFIPDGNSKTRKGFTVPLTPVVIVWLHELETLACGSRYVLPARQGRRLKTHKGEIHYEQRALNAMIHKLCDRLGDKVRRFTPHDLRSTARSHLAAMGVNIIIAERCLNHSLGGLVAIYDQHDYMDERRSALEKWADYLNALEAGAKVLPFRAMGQHGNAA